MFDLDVALRRWRERQERKSSLSPRELDELEDHLRARVELELEMNAALAPTRAFAIARRDLGPSAPLSREFAKAGKPRWRKLLVVGWATFAASFLLPVSYSFRFVPPGVLPGAIPFSEPGILWGWMAFLGAIGLWEDPVLPLMALSNALLLATFLKVGGTRPHRTPWLARILAAAGALNLWLVAPFLWDPGWWVVTNVGIGYWAWVGSFFCVAAALRMRAKEWTAAKPEALIRITGQGVFE